MSDTLIEAVARALCPISNPDTPVGVHYRERLMERLTPARYTMHDAGTIPAWKQSEHLARAAIAAIEASGTHRVVPVVATESMDIEGKGQLVICLADLATMNWAAHNVYQAMLSAAPKVVL